MLLHSLDLLRDHLRKICDCYICDLTKMNDCFWVKIFVHIYLEFLIEALSDCSNQIISITAFNTKIVAEVSM